MATTTTNAVLQQIRRLVDDERTRGRSDEELLTQFASQRDEAAFQALVRRHGPMALDVCRAVLGNDADAEDAFQATFLVLARKAQSIRKKSTLGCWIHGVAYRIALASRRRSTTRSRHETRQPPPAAAAPEDLTWHEAQRILHEELARLAERQRAPLVLCYLQAKTQDEAALILGISKSTLKLRLEKARALLRARLVRRGLGPAFVLVAAAWPGAAALASVPPALLAVTVETAAGQALPAVVAPKVAALADAALRATLFRKVATALVVAFIVSLCGLGSGWLVWQNHAVGNEPQAAPAAAQPAPGAPAALDDMERFVALLKAQEARRFPGADDLGLFLMDLGKGDVSLIAAGVDQERAYCGSPCWSGDGRRILFDSSPGKKFDQTRLQQIEAKDQGLALSSQGAGNCPTLSPDGKHIAFLLNPAPGANEEAGIWLMQADGTQRRHLGGYGIPRWSPGGQRLMVIPFANPCKPSLLDAQTGEEHAVDFAGHQVYSVPSWVAGDTVVAVVRSQQGFSISLVEVTDGGAARVKEMLWKRGDRLDVEPLYPVYSPRTRRCVFVGRDKQGQALYGFEHGKGEAPRRLEQGELDSKIASLALSPDGRYLLFCSDRPWPRLPVLAPGRK